MSTNNSNSDNEKELMDKVFAVIGLIIVGYLMPIISSALIPLFFLSLGWILLAILGIPTDGMWDEIVEAVILFANFGKIFSPIAAILLPIACLLPKKDENQ